MNASQWTNIQPLTILFASNGIALVDDGTYTHACEKDELERAIAAAKMKPASTGEDCVASDYSDFCGTFSGVVLNDRGFLQHREAERIKAAMEELGYEGLL